MRFESTIEEISKDGSGVCQGPNGKKYFVFGAWIGDHGEFEVLTQKHPNKKFGYAKLVELQKKSAARIKAQCQHWGTNSGQCQGCSWMPIRYDAQLEQKRRRLQFSFSRFGSIELKNIEVIASPKKEHYRNRLILKSDGVKIGFVNRSSRVLSPITECLIANEKCNSLLKTAYKKITEEDLSPKGKHQWTLIEFDDQTEKIVPNQKLSFRQGNTGINNLMQNWVYQNIKNINPKLVLELFCGSGNFTEMIHAGSDCSIYAYEGSQNAIQALTEKGIPKVQAKTMNLFKEIPKLKLKIDTLLLDPPREGFKELTSLVKEFSSLHHILYISCDSDTMARDLSPLMNEWEMVSTTLMDQFPHTPHFETLLYLRKKFN